jgi:methionine-rich copper-binding protein CopC
MKRRWIAVAALVVVCFTGRAHAQVRAGAPQDDSQVTPVELRRLLDAYSIVQAQEFLKISDEQYARFLPRFKALLDTRRQTLQQHTRVLNVVRRLLMEAQPDEGMLRDALKQLQEIDIRGEADARRAYEAIDQVLDLRQQAKFRVFEEQMERRKLELVAQAQARVRQLNRQNRQEQKLP